MPNQYDKFDLPKLEKIKRIKKQALVVKEKCKLNRQGRPTYPIGCNSAKTAPKSTERRLVQKNANYEEKKLKGQIRQIEQAINKKKEKGWKPFQPDLKF